MIFMGHWGSHDLQYQLCPALFVAILCGNETYFTKTRTEIFRIQTLDVKRSSTEQKWQRLWVRGVPRWALKRKIENLVILGTGQQWCFVWIRKLHQVCSYCILDITCTKSSKGSTSIALHCNWDFFFTHSQAIWKYGSNLHTLQNIKTNREFKCTIVNDNQVFPTTCSS